MLDTAAYYDHIREPYLVEDEIPDWAPRSALTVTLHEEAALARIEKRIARQMLYGEAVRVIAHMRSSQGIPVKRFIERARLCPDCQRWHTDQANFYGLCLDCLPF